MRTNFNAVQQLMDNNIWGTRRIADVRDVFDCSQQRMHLDTIFNVVSDNLCILLETVMGENSKHRRLVNEYTINNNGKYVLSKKDVEFSKYLKDEGFTIIPITEQEQAEYGINFLNLGNENIISVHKGTATKIIKSGKFNGKINVIPFDGMQTMFGSVHCCSQVLSRHSINRVPKFDQIEELNELKLIEEDKSNVVMVSPSFGHATKREYTDKCRIEFSVLH